MTEPIRTFKSLIRPSPGPTASVVVTPAPLASGIATAGDADGELIVPSPPVESENGPVADPADVDASSLSGKGAPQVADDGMLIVYRLELVAVPSPGSVG